MPKFGQSERHIIEIFNKNKTFIFNNEMYTINTIGKPTCSKGEPKTDIYISATSDNGFNKEFKISFKQENADFIENKTTAERAEALLGPNWSQFISEATNSIKDKFEKKSLIFKSKGARTEEGSITVGWKYELLNKAGGELSGIVNLTFDQIIDVYAGTHLSIDKTNALVNGVKTTNSGIANFILMHDNLDTAQEVIDNIIPLEEYVKKYPVVYFACKALNYRTYPDKFDGNRPLSVYVDWNIVDGKLSPALIFDNPLKVGGNEVVAKLKNSMDTLGIKTTKDIDDDKIINAPVIKK